VSVTEGDRAVLNCSATTGARLTWFQRPTREVVTNKDKHITEEGALIFDMVRKEDEGSYQCQAKVNDSTVSHNTHWAYLRVFGQFNSIKYSNPNNRNFLILICQIFLIIVPAILTEYTSTSTVRYGTRYEAKCFAEGDPLPRVRWLINDEEVNTGTTHKSQGDNSLRVTYSFISD